MRIDRVANPRKSRAYKIRKLEQKLNLQIRCSEIF